MLLFEVECDSVLGFSGTSLEGPRSRSAHSLALTPGTTGHRTASKREGASAFGASTARRPEKASITPRCPHPLPRVPWRPLSAPLHRPGLVSLTTGTVGRVSEYKLRGQKVYPETEGSHLTEESMMESLMEENSLLFVLGAQSVQADGALSKLEEDEARF